MTERTWVPDGTVEQMLTNLEPPYLLPGFLLCNLKILFIT